LDEHCCCHHSWWDHESGVCKYRETDCGCFWFHTPGSDEDCAECQKYAAHEDEDAA
jgi:hypothetical protein